MVREWKIKRALEREREEERKKGVKGGGGCSAGAGWRSAVPVKPGGIARSSNLKYFNNYLSAYLEHNNGRKERSEYSKYSSRKLLQNAQINFLYMMGHYIRLQKLNFTPEKVIKQTSSPGLLNSFC